jgi:hypothetical protein
LHILQITASHHQLRQLQECVGVIWMQNVSLIKLRHGLIIALQLMEGHTEAVMSFRVFRPKLNYAPKFSFRVGEPLLLVFGAPAFEQQLYRLVTVGMAGAEQPR